jgi:ankyrin repeat protein
MAKKPDMELVRYLFEANPLLLNMHDEHENLPIHYAACYSQSFEFIQYIFQSFSTLTKAHGFEGELPLHFACARNNVDICRHILDADSSVLFLYDYKGMTPFHVACDRGDFEIVELLLRHSPEIVSARHDESSCLPLHHCASNGNIEIFMQVYNMYPAAISIVAGTAGTPLKCAIMYGHEEIVRIICTHHANCVSTPDSENELPLSEAISWYDASMAIVELVYDVYPQAMSICDTYGYLPIHKLFYLNSFKSENDLAANKLRFILDKYPECVNIPNSPQNPYDLSLTKPDFVQRLMLRAQPDIDLQRYHDLNYNARRMGIFLGFTAITKDGTQSLFHKLQVKNYDSFRVMISFL